MKNKLLFVAICVLVVWVLSGAVWYVRSLFAEDLTEIESMNKYYAEETIKSEMRFIVMKEYMDNVGVEEYIETFFKVQHDK